MTDSNAPVSVLVIDDEPGLQKMLVFGLSDRGFKVTTAGSGDEGLEHARHKIFDLLICDIMMPGKSGIEVLKEFRQIQPQTEVIMATGFATLETAVEAMKLGAFDYITKPYSLDQLEVIFRKALEHRRLKSKVDRLEELNRLKSEFLANMSHELRTPMNAIIGYTSLLMDRLYGDLNPKQEQGLKRIQVNAKNLLELINNILDLSKLSAGRMPLFPEKCSLRQIAQEVAETMDCLARERHLKLVCEVPADIELKADKTKIKQVLVNLVANGIKFTHEGSVTVSAEVLAEPPAVRLRVQDTGIGMKEEDIPKIFEEFQQLDASPTREYGGTGLGLSISKKIVELHGGSIEVQSRPGAGTTFTITLPLEAKPVGDASPAPRPLLPAVAAPDDKIVLGIDDDPEVLALLADSLQGTGFKFVGASSGEEGLALARKLRPHAITLDVMMPHMDGWSVLQKLKSDPALHDLPVFIVSIVENRALAFSLGVADYIVKPFERTDLLAKLRLLEKNPARHRVLVVDDDPSVADLFTEVLRSEGYSVETASKRAQVMDALKNSKPDVLFLDLMMPQMSGFDVLDTIDQDPNLRDIRVFVMTAKNLTGEETTYLESRAEAIVQKGSRDIGEVLSLLKTKLKTVNLAVAS